MMKGLLRLLGLLLFAFSTSCWSVTVQTFGAGSAVSVVNRAATFDTLDYTHNGTSLSHYTEGTLSIATSGDSFTGYGPNQPPYFNPFHLPLDPATQAFYYPLDGNNEWVTISTTDHQAMHGLEFLYGNGWTTGDINGVPWGNDKAWVEWRTYLDGNLVSSGVIGPEPVLNLGTTIGFFDVQGFDQLDLRCLINNSGDPNLQALALDDVVVQTAPVPEPFTGWLAGSVILVLIKRSRNLPKV